MPASPLGQHWWGGHGTRGGIADSGVLPWWRHFARGFLGVLQWRVVSAGVVHAIRLLPPHRMR